MDETRLRALFAECDVGWVFDGQSAEEAAELTRRIAAEMRGVEGHFERVFGRPLDRPLDQLFSLDVARFKPLVQSFASPLTPDMRTMVFCLLDGAHITKLSFEYERKRRVHLDVSILYNGDEGRFQSEDLWDAEVLRHFGLIKLGGAPVLDGYYAFRKGEP